MSVKYNNSVDREVEKEISHVVHCCYKSIPSLVQQSTDSCRGSYGEKCAKLSVKMCYLLNAQGSCVKIFNFFF